MSRSETGRLGHGLGKFEIIERLGSGGMGSVYLAYDPELDRRLAVKVLGGESDDSIAPGSTFRLREISPELIAAPGTEVMSHRLSPSESSQELLVEARAMAQLSHPNVVSIYDVGSSDGQLFIAMELVEGDNLRQWLARERRPRGEILDAFRQAAAGLTAAHRAGLIHRDFKPDNVLIDADGAVRVADFGLALDEATRISGMAGIAKSLAGTPGYIAPELLAGGRPTPTSDVYAFCVALLEALGGARPATPLELAEAKSVVRGLGRLPRALRAGLARGLCADPSLRPADGAGLVAMLEKKHAARTTLIAVAALAGLGGAAVAFAAARAGNGDGDNGDEDAGDVCEPPGLVVHLAFDETSGTSASDASGSGHNGTLMGPTDADWVAGRIGNALSFDGMDDQVSAGSPAALDDLRTLTVCAWIFPRSYPTEFPIIADKSANSFVGGWNLYIEKDDTFGFLTNGEKVANGGRIDLNVWQHVCASWDGSAGVSGVNLFRDGAVASMNEAFDNGNQDDSDAMHSLVLGQANDGSNDYDGLIDDFRLYDRVLSVGEVNSLFVCADTAGKRK